MFLQSCRHLQIKLKALKKKQRKSCKKKNYSVSSSSHLGNQIKALCKTEDISKFPIFNGMHHICPIIRHDKSMRQRKQGVKPLFVMQLLLHIHCSVGFFKAAHVPTDTGWWARTLAASSWRLKRKRHPVSGYTHVHTWWLYHSIGCLYLPYA